MNLELGEQNLDKFIMVGDRVLIKPKSPLDKTQSGLFLPPGIQAKEKTQAGYVLKVGPGYPIPAINDSDEPWKEKHDEVKYLPLQLKVGDMAIFLQNSGYEFEFKKEAYIIVPHSAILMIIRDENLFE